MAAHRVSETRPILGACTRSWAVGVVATIALHALGCGSNGPAEDAGAMDAQRDAQSDATWDAAACASCPDHCLGGRCVACLRDQQCVSGLCDADHNCESYAACTSSSTAACPAIRPVCFNMRCVECIDDEDCAGSERGLFCHWRGQRCAECVHSADCASGTCRLDGSCAGGDACERVCAPGERVDLYGRCVPTRACADECVGESACEPTTGRCVLTDDSWPSCSAGETADEFGRCMPECPCPEGEVWHATLGSCAAPIECASPLSTLASDPTRCRFPACDDLACAATDACIDGRCRPSSCGPGAPPFTCREPGPFQQNVGGESRRRIPSVRVAKLGPGASLTRIAVANGSILWEGDSGAIEWAQMHVGRPQAGRPPGSESCYELVRGDTFADCDDSTQPAIPFIPDDFAVSYHSNRLGAARAPGAAEGAAGIWQLGVGEGGLDYGAPCGRLLAMGNSAADGLMGHVGLTNPPARDDTRLFGLAQDAAGVAYPRMWSTTARGDLSAAGWASAFGSAGDVSLPSTHTGYGNGVAAYVTRDARIVAWDGGSDSVPLLMRGIDHVVGEPLIWRGLWLVAQQVGGSSEMVTTRCTSAAGRDVPMACDAIIHSPIDSLAADPSLAIAFFGGAGFLAAEELTSVPGEVRLSLHELSSSDVPAEHGHLLFDSSFAGAPLRDILALHLAQYDDDIGWAAIVEVERDGTLQAELWAGAWRVCAVYLGP